VARRDRNHLQASQMTKADALATVTHQSVSFSGPLPHPSLLAKYNEVIPNGAERIMAMAERQSAHREALETLVITGNVKAQARGTVFAFIVCIIALSAGFYLVHEGREVAGFASIVGAMGGVLGTFIYSKKGQRKERDEKANALQAKNRS
jgi:uncharacterized membrane protein